MAGNTGPNIVNNGLVLYLDAANKKKSFLPFSTFLNMSTWATGSGGATGFGRNGDLTENERVIGTDPWGNSTVVWESRPSGNGNDDGGWNTDWYNVDKTKLYRFSVWVKRTSSTSGGYSYLGLYGNTGVARLDNGATESNPYWECSSTSVYTQNVWYLLVGHCYPSGTTGILGNRHPDTGRYTINGRNGDVNFCNIGGDVRWLSDTTQTLHRTYHYYCNDSTTRLQWFDPRIDLCDGTEPTIQDLLTAGTNSWRSMVNENKGILTNGVTYNSSNLGSLVFDGTNDYILLGPIPFTGNSTKSVSWCIWVNPASTFGNIMSMASTNPQGGWNMPPIAAIDQKFRGKIWSNNYLYSSSTYVLNQWYYLVLVFDYQNSQQRFYVNGMLQDSQSNITYDASGTNNYIFLGQSNHGADNTGMFSGKIGLFQIYGDKALTTQEILQNYNAQKSRFGLP